MKLTVPLTGTYYPEDNTGDMDDPVRVASLPGLGDFGWQVLSHDFDAGTAVIEVFLRRKSGETDGDYTTRRAECFSAASAAVAGKTMVQLQTASGQPALKRKAKP